MGDVENEIEEESRPVAEPKKKSPIIQWLIYAAAGIVGILIVTVISVLVAQKTATSVFKQQKNIALVKAPPPLEVFNFTDEFRVNTADVGEVHFIKLKLAFGYEEGQLALGNELVKRSPQMQNIINLIISRKTKEELKTIAQQLDLREEIKAHINHILSEGKIKEVYFKEFIIN